MDGLSLVSVSTQSEILYDLRGVDRIAITRMSWVFFFFFFFFFFFLFFCFSFHVNFWFFIFLHI